MTIEEIRANAPDGATHYIDIHGVTYHKCDGDIWYFWDCVFKSWEYMHPTWVHGIKPL